MRIGSFKVALVHALLLWVVPLVAQADMVNSNCPRLALLVGNRSYSGEWGELNNPLNDVDQLGKRLGELGWQTEIVKNRNKAQLDADVDALASRARAQRACQVLLYYSGHGMEWEKGNFLIPVDLESDSGPQVQRLAVPLQDIVYKLSVVPGIKVVLLDACRLPPTKAGGNGLAKPDVPHEMLIGYAAISGGRVSDAGLETGPYAQALLQALSDESLHQNGSSFLQVMEQVELLTPKFSKEVSRIEQRPITFGHIGPKKRFVFGSAGSKAARQLATSPKSAPMAPEQGAPSDLSTLPRPLPISNSTGTVEQLLPKRN